MNDLGYSVLASIKLPPQVSDCGRRAGQGAHDRGGDGGGQGDEGPPQATGHARHLGQDQGGRGPHW
jgi:hypothetical protein